MITRPLLIAAALLALTQAAFAQEKSDTIAAPTLRASSGYGASDQSQPAKRTPVSA